MKFKKIKLFLLIFFLCSNLNAIENKILIKINNEIITTLDIYDELKYLKALNPKIQELDDQTSLEVSKNSVIREKIKEIGILRERQNIEGKDELLEKQIENIYLNIGLKSIEEFKDYLNNSGLTINFVKKKINIEMAWNDLIVSKFRSKVIIDRKKIKNEINNRKLSTIKEFLISEIFFNIEENSLLDEKVKSIENDIVQKGFKNAAIVHSKSNSANNGGDIGWVSENSVNKEIKLKLNNLKIGQHTKPIILPGGFVILKIEDIKESDLKINFDEEVKKLIRYKTTQQYDQFSNIYFKRVEKDLIINEL